MKNRWRKHLLVPDDLIKLADEFAQALIRHYANGGSSRSRSRSGDRGTERNPVLQARGKIGECALAIYFGLNPRTAVKWSLIADGGTDIHLPNGLRADTKTTLEPFKLIWSNNVNDLYHEKQFDVLVSVSIDEHDRRKCWIEGFVTKAEFFELKQIKQPGIGPSLEIGTWYMDKSALWDIDELRLASPPKIEDLAERFHGDLLWRAWERQHDVWEMAGSPR